MFRGVTRQLLKRAFGGVSKPSTSLLGSLSTARPAISMPSMRRFGSTQYSAAEMNGATDIPLSTQASGPSHLHLASLLDRELKEEKELLQTEERPEVLGEIADRIQKRFHIKETPGSSIVKMHSKHDTEKVQIQFDCQDTTDDEIEEEHLEEDKIDDYTVGIRGLATVAKGHHKMMFSLVFTNTIWVEKVAFDTQGREWDDETIYWSDFNEYPEDVKDAFTHYLAERHIDDDLALYVSYYGDEKEKAHYVEFLQDVKAFVGGK